MTFSALGTEGGPSLGDGPPLVTCRALTVALGTGHAQVVPLRDLDLTAVPGELVAVRGPSGSGKSTLLGVLAGDIAPQSGEVAVAGVSPRDARRTPGIGLVYQDFRLVTFLTGLENVAMALEIRGIGSHEATDRSHEMMITLGVDHLAERFPSEMSGGEQQRIALARTMVTHPPLVLADEPTASLDRTTAQAVVELLRTAAHELGATMIIATHDAMVAAATDTTYDLVDGRLYPALADVG